MIARLTVWLLAPLAFWGGVGALCLHHVSAAPIDGGSATQRAAVERAMTDRPDIAASAVAVLIVPHDEMCRVSAVYGVRGCLAGIAIVRGGGAAGYADGTVLLDAGLPAAWLYDLALHEFEHLAAGRGSVHPSIPLTGGPRAVNPREYGER